MLDTPCAPKPTMSKPAMPQLLMDFVSSQLNRLPSIDLPHRLSLTPLSGDAGFRQYFRVNTQPPLLAVQAPIDAGLSESAEHFAQLSQQLIAQGVPSPQVFALDAEQNMMLVEDMGEDLLLSELNHDSAHLLYGEALMVLARMQQIPRASVQVGNYDAHELQSEMALFPEWFVKALLGHRPTAEQSRVIQQCFNFLTMQALEQPQTLVHRDYHSRNLIYRQGEAPGVIDFQDALWGPITYDVVSLLRDCYIRWPEENVEQWLMAYGNVLIGSGVMPLVSTDQWRRWFDFMGLQRHLKVLGIFARLALRDKKSNYLNDLPLVLRYTLEAAEKYDETRALAHMIKQDLLPLIQKQHWYRDYQTAGDE